MSERYDASNIKVLKGLDAVRLRAGMFIGDTGKKGLHHLVNEALDNSVDEFMAGYCNAITIKINKDGETISIEDNGRGIPTDIHPTEKISTLEVVMTQLHAGGKFDEKGYATGAGGLHGVGISCVNALSDALKAEVWRDGHYWVQEYNIGKPLYKVKKEAVSRKQTGTKITFHADKTIFKDGIAFDETVILRRLREEAFLNKNLKIEFINDNTGTKETFHSEGGIADYIKWMISGKTNPYPQEPIYSQDQYDLISRSGKVNVELSLIWNNEDDENILSFVNNINTHDGGTHLSGFKTALTRVVNNFARKLELIKEKDNNLSGDDIREGLTAILSIRFPQPEFVGQTKDKLGTVEIEGIVTTATSELLTAYFDKNVPVVKKIIERAKIAQEARDAAKKQSALIKRKSFLGNNRMPGKLTDCNTNKSANAELFIVEGDSAGGGCKLGRDPETQAILPIRGKILNAEKSDLTSLLKNQEIQSIILSIGAGFKDDFDIEKIKYDKVILQCLGGETEIRTLDGRHPTIQQLAEENKPVWIWSKYGEEILPFFVNPPKKTRTETEWLKLTFSDGSVIECTKDHPFVINFPNPEDKRIIYKEQGNGYRISCIKAKDLLCSDSIGHVDFKYCKSSGDEIMKYNHNKSKTVHKFIWELFASEEEKEMKKNKDIHHLDFNHKNNSPFNLCALSKSEHNEIHAEKHGIHISNLHKEGVYKNTSTFITYNKTKQHSENIKNHHKNGTYKEVYNNFVKNYNGSELQQKHLKKNWSENGIYRSKEYSEKLSEGSLNHYKEHPERTIENSNSAKKQWNDEEKRLNISTSKLRKILLRTLESGITLEQVNKDNFNKFRKGRNDPYFDKIFTYFKTLEEFARYAYKVEGINCNLIKSEIIKGEKDFYCFSIPGVGNFVLKKIISGNCDSDFDGAHISSLLITFFYRFMRPLIQKGHLYIAQAPLFKVTKGKDKFFCLDEKEMQNKVKELGENAKVTRFKGLGEMNPEELAETTMSKDNRTLIQITLESAADAERMVGILMGDDSQLRKDHIISKSLSK